MRRGGAGAVRRLAAVAMPLCVALAACGSSSPSGVATNPAPPTSTEQTASSTGSQTQVASGIRTVIAPLGLNMRSADDPHSQLLGTLAQGTVVTVLARSDRNGGWLQVRGSSQTGWITADSRYSSPRHFTVYDSQSISALYPDTWTFSDHTTSVVFTPQSGSASVVITMAQDTGALGTPGRTGYTVVGTDSAEVFGITGVLHRYDRTGTAPAPSPGGVAFLGHLVQIRVTVDSSHAVQVEGNYDQQQDLDIFDDIYNSIVLKSALASPSPSPGTSAPPGPPTPL